jgi:putative chitobiose transport system permease protein
MNPPRLQRLFLTGVAALISAVFLAPILWLLASAFRPELEIFAYLEPLGPRVLIPVEPTLENFRNLLAGEYPRAIFNSLFVAASSVALGLLICAMAAFALSAIGFPGRDVVFAVVVVSFLIPFEGVAIPLLDLFRGWGLANSYAGLILPGVANGLAIFLLRQFFMAVPRELISAAQIDGATWWSIFWRIYLPLARPAMISAGLMLFVWQWQAYLWPLLIAADPSLHVAPVALAKYLAQYDFDFGQLFAGAFLLALIPILVLLPLQRYFTQSVASSGLKD